MKAVNNSSCLYQIQVLQKVTRQLGPDRWAIKNNQKQEKGERNTPIPSWLENQEDKGLFLAWAKTRVSVTSCIVTENSVAVRVCKGTDLIQDIINRIIL